jgi:cardiolipin synthase C
MRILTKSLASYDVPAVNTHYEQWRRPLIESGIELHEIRPYASIHKEIANTPPPASKFMGLHTKAVVMDRKRGFIGSMTLDRRSAEVNSEMGAVIESSGLADA